jgi:hypothetical protein
MAVHAVILSRQIIVRATAKGRGINLLSFNSIEKASGHLIQIYPQSCGASAVWRSQAHGFQRQLRRNRGNRVSCPRTGFGKLPSLFRGGGDGDQLSSKPRFRDETKITLSLPNLAIRIERRVIFFHDRCYRPWLPVHSNCENGLRLQRCQVGGNRHDIRIRQLGHRLLHQLRPWAIPRARLNVNDLPGHLARRATGNGRNVPQPP